jgi:hypothetical protein
MSNEGDEQSNVITHRERDGTVIAVSASFSVAEEHFNAIHSKARRAFGEDVKITKDEEKDRVVFSKPGLRSPTSILH